MHKVIDRYRRRCRCGHCNRRSDCDGSYCQSCQWPEDGRDSDRTGNLALYPHHHGSRRVSWRFIFHHLYVSWLFLAGCGSLLNRHHRRECARGITGYSDRENPNYRLNKFWNDRFFVGMLDSHRKADGQEKLPRQKFRGS